MCVCVRERERDIQKSVSTDNLNYTDDLDKNFINPLKVLNLIIEP